MAFMFLIIKNMNAAKRFGKRVEFEEGKEPFLKRFFPSSRANHLTWKVLLICCQRLFRLTSRQVFQWSDG